jgi:hypothetical protein
LAQIAGDFTHDGRTDLLLRHQQNGGLELWTVEGSPLAPRKLATLATSTDLGWHVNGFFPQKH